MAWIVSAWMDQNYEVDVVGDSEDRLSALVAQVRDQATQRPRGDPYWHNGAYGPSLSEGFRFPQPASPFAISIVRATGPLPDIMPTRLGYAITDRIVDRIEAEEPGVHQYLPLDLEFADSIKDRQGRRLLNICTRLDTIAADRSEGVVEGGTPEMRRWGMTRYGIRDWRKEVLCWSAKTAGHSIWYEYKLAMVAVSDDFAGFLERGSVVGLDRFFLGVPRHFPEI